jgi:hypothetical protein
MHYSIAAFKVQRRKMGEPSPLLAKVLPASLPHFTAVDARAAGGFPRVDDMREACALPAILPAAVSPGYSPLRIPSVFFTTEARQVPHFVQPSMGEPMKNRNGLTLK